MVQVWQICSNLPRKYTCKKLFRVSAFCKSVTANSPFSCVSVLTPVFTFVLSFTYFQKALGLDHLWIDGLCSYSVKIFFTIITQCNKIPLPLPCSRFSWLCSFHIKSQSDKSISHTECCPYQLYKFHCSNYGKSWKKRTFHLISVNHDWKHWKNSLRNTRLWEINNMESIREYFCVKVPLRLMIPSK